MEGSNADDEQESPFQFSYLTSDDNYVDLSQQMIDELNNGQFDKTGVDENVMRISFS